MLVVAPAGAGKTTLLAQFAEQVRSPLAWYCPEARDRSEADVLAHVQGALQPAGLMSGAVWRTVDDALHALDRTVTDGLVLVVDDLHVVSGTAAEHALGRLASLLPRSVTLVAASRSEPAFDLSRFRLAGDVLDIDGDDLRFRTWEVERLFRDVYNEPLRPEDQAALARRTRGWAAGLQLFHLATRGQPASERRRTLTRLEDNSRLVREYLARHVLEGLGPELRRFLVDTCVLPVLNGTVCDRLLSRTGSADLLRELEARQLFTQSLDAAGWYRYHDVLRDHLEATLLEEVGEPEVRARSLRAGRLLETAGKLHDALHAYCRGECGEDVARLLGERGERLADDAGEWVEDLPGELVASDPWLLLVAARRLVAAGRWSAALDTYRRAEHGFRSSAGVDRCRRERAALRAWLDPLSPATRTDPTSLVRAAARRAPLGQLAAADRSTSAGQLAAALCALLGGDARAALRWSDGVRHQPAVEPVLAAGALAVAGLAAWLAGEAAHRRRLRQAVESFERLGCGWLASISRAASATADGEVEDVARLREERVRAGDPWGAALTAVLEGLAGLTGDRPDPAPFDAAADGFRRLGAGTLECWARAGQALAACRSGPTGATQLVTTADALARSVEAPGALVLTALARAHLDPRAAGEHRLAARRAASELGIDVRALCGAGRDHLQPGPVSADHGDLLRCLGGFRLVLGGRAVEVGDLRPRVANLLYLLALHVGRPVHREVIVEALWPDADLAAGVGRLQVAISSLRRVLEPDAARGRWTRLTRAGEAYRLTLDGSEIDLVTFDRALRDACHARTRADRAAQIRALEEALRTYAGDLLPEAGPAEWVVGERDRYATLAAEAAQQLSELHLAAGEVPRAVAACERGLRIDRYRGLLWRRLARAHERAGDLAAAARARQAHAEVLDELGIDPRPGPRVTAASGTPPP